MSVTTLQPKIRPYQRETNPTYPDRTGLPKIQIPIALRNQTSSTLSYTYKLTNEITGVMRIEMDALYSKNLVRANITDGPLTFNRPFLTIKVSLGTTTPGSIVGESQKTPGQYRYNNIGTISGEFPKDGIIIPHSPDANGLCDFHANPIVIANLKDPKNFESLRLEVTDIYDRPVEFDDLVIILNVYCMYDN
jgi:hypothetical protein